MVEFTSLFILLATTFSVVYFLLITWFIIGWKRTSKHYFSKHVFNTKVAVIVPYYNEENSIEECLMQLCTQQISTTSYQVIAIDDFSSDDSANIVSGLTKKNENLISIKNIKKGKKNALQLAISKTNADLIIMTDADCSFHKLWACSIVSYWEKHNPKMIIAPVCMDKKKGIFQKFQQLEFNSLIMTTAGSCGIQHPIMCNGANLAFCKETYLKISNPHNNMYLSGDDMFLMHNFKTIFPNDIHFLKSEYAIVRTKPMLTINDFIKQRIRWFSKHNGYTDNDTKFTALVVFTVCVLIFIGIIGSFFNEKIIMPTLFLFITKTTIDFILFSKSKKLLNHSKLLYLIPAFEIIYIFYVVSVSIMGMLGKNKYINLNK